MIWYVLTFLAGVAFGLSSVALVIRAKMKMEKKLRVDHLVK
jgi:hypothetical protein